MTENKTFRCVSLDQVVDPDAFREALLKAFFGGEIPEETVPVQKEGMTDPTLE